jgi:hypothetical protein
MPSPDQIRSRETAMEAERHWWVKKLREHIAGLEPMARTTTNIGHWTQIEIEALSALIAERSR